jgi:hypothetical protein
LRSFTLRHGINFTIGTKAITERISHTQFARGSMKKKWVLSHPISSAIAQTRKTIRGLVQ